MWHRSASFILDKRENDDVLSSESRRMSSLSMAAEAPQQPNPNNPNISAYYQTRAAHHGVVTSDWLAQAQAAVGHSPDGAVTENSLSKTVDSGKTFSVIDEFNNWRKQPDLAEAVAAIRALASVIRSSEATTMMELEIELKKASDSLKTIIGVFSENGTCCNKPWLFLFLFELPQMISWRRLCVAFLVLARNEGLENQLLITLLEL